MSTTDYSSTIFKMCYEYCTYYCTDTVRYTVNSSVNNTLLSFWIQYSEERSESLLIVLQRIPHGKAIAVNMSCSSSTNKVDLLLFYNVVSVIVDIKFFHKPMQVLRLRET